MTDEPFIHIEAPTPTGAFKLTKRPSDLRLREYGPTQPTGLCRCGHAAARHDRVSFKDSRAPQYPCLDPDCPCTEMWRE